MFIDLTEILQHPYRTGIQRVEREIIKHWPKNVQQLQPVRFDRTMGRFVHVSRKTFDILANPPQSMEEELLALSPLTSDCAVADDDILAAALFNPELFADAARGQAYERLSRINNANITWLVYDFFPFLLSTNPEGTDRVFLPYRHALSAIQRQCFISEQTRTQFGVFYQRMPCDVGPALALGGDGLHLEKQTFAPDRTTFVCLGSIDPRKNLLPVMKAFQLLWSRGVDAELTLIGRLMQHAVEEPGYILQMSRDSRFKHFDRASDDEVKGILRGARATIFASTLEGYGLPPIESLASGIPVIVSSTLPSMTMLAGGGRIGLNDITPESIATAVEQLMDDEFAQSVWDDASDLKTPTWDHFARDLAEWLLHDLGER